MSGGITINSNLAALGAQRRLGLSTASLQQSFTRLSSGLRINKASDDAAGLAISEALNADKRVFAQGVRNLNDGVSLISIADGALSELSGIVIRLTELAEQAGNGTLGSAQRKALDEEAQALKAEYFRISKSTAFNGRKLFDGDFGELRLQVGYGADGGIASGVGGAIGTGGFTPRESYGVGGSPISVTSGDFNGDGVLDLVTADFGPNTASVLLGLGDGTFKSRVSYATGSNPWSITTGDFNGDGALDLVTADQLSRTASVLLGLGDGTFKSRVSYAAGDVPYSITSGDFNGDGMLDLVTADLGSNTISLLLGLGDGGFKARVSYATGNGPHSITSGDFNGDGVLDLVTADYGSNTASVLLGVGDGTFKSRVSYDTGIGPRSVISGDFNGDGVLDLVTADQGSSTASVLLGLGDGTFKSRVSHATGSNPWSITTGDFNGDGVLDLVTADSSSNTASVLLGLGDGTFKERVSYATGNGPYSSTSGDFNGDGVLDLVTADLSSNSVSILLAETTPGVAPLLDFSLATQADARQALPVFKQKLDQLASQRGQLGAFEARLSTAISTLAVTTENVSAAASQIMDADVAEESARLVRNQILQQAGAAVLAQANQQPTIALSLLGALR